MRRRREEEEEEERRMVQIKNDGAFFLFSDSSILLLFIALHCIKCYSSSSSIPIYIYIIKDYFLFPSMYVIILEYEII